ncbi:MAG: transaldolase [Xanthomonadales bacterium]|nr:transaldolase [Xanthomonadales bacterium]
MSRILTLYREYGQSIWLDYIDRNLLLRDGLKTLISEGLRGVTSNPTIFHKAIGGSTDYDEPIRDLLQANHQIDDGTLYEWLVVQDAQMAADILEPVYVSSEGLDGYVSLEVSPYIAHDSALTIKEARHLWRAVNRPNLMIKVPATEAGLPATEQLLAEGINVNNTLLFSVERYKAVAETYLRGVARAAEPAKIASVASFFISRVDSKVDAALDEIGGSEARALKGRIAIANARMAYQHFIDTVASEPFQAQEQRGARPQRPLWASTSTKNPDYSDVMYVEQLIGPDTVNTLPPATLDAFEAHGELRATLDVGLKAAQRDLETLGKLGIDLWALSDELEQEGIRKFMDSYDQALNTLDEKRFKVAQRYASE